MTTSRTFAPVSRRRARAGLGAGGLGLALAAHDRHATAQDATADARVTHLSSALQNLVGTRPCD